MQSSSKPLSLYIRLANGDEGKVEKVKKIIEENFNLSPRGIREMLQLTSQSMKLPLPTVTLEESQQIKVNLAGKNR